VSCGSLFLQHVCASSCAINRNRPLLRCPLSLLMHVKSIKRGPCMLLSFATRQLPFVTLNLHAITSISDFTSSRSLHNLCLGIWSNSASMCEHPSSLWYIYTLIIWRNAKFDSARLLMFSQITSKFLGTKSRSSDGLIDETWFPFCFNSKFSLKLVILCTVTLYRFFSSLFE